MFAPRRRPPCLITSVAALKTRMKEIGPDATPSVDCTGDPSGRIREKLYPVPPPVLWMIEVSRKVIIVADATKFGRPGMVPVAPLEMADGLPLNLTFSQLKARYPGGKLENLNLGEGDGSRMFTLPNKIRFIGAGKPDMVSAGELGVCE